MSKNLVTYFSVSGVTKSAAERIGRIIGADVVEIEPKEIYDEQSVDWRNPESRASKENADTSSRPEITEIKNIGDYDVVFVGFPVWWNVEPRAVDTFLEKYDFSNKTIIPFATSGGSTIDGSVQRIRTIVKQDVKVKDGKVIVAQDSDDDIRTWVQSVLS